MIWSISYHLNVIDFGLWSCGLCGRTLKSWHILRIFRKIWGIWAGNSDDLKNFLFISIISIFRPVVFSLDLAACLAGTLSCFSLTILVPYQNGGLKTTGSWVKIPQILKLNHSHSKHWNQVLNHLNGSLWTKSSGILVFLFMSSIYCIARTLVMITYINVGEVYLVL